MRPGPAGRGRRTRHGAWAVRCAHPALRARGVRWIPRVYLSGLAARAASEAWLMTRRPVPAGAELLVHYGATLPRTGHRTVYGPAAAAAPAAAGAGKKSSAGPPHAV